MGLAMRFVGSHTSFFWKDDIRAEAMTWQAFLDCTAWKVTVIASSGHADSGAPVELSEGGGRTMLGLVNPPWAPSHRARRKPSGRNFLCVCLPQAVEEVGLWPPQYHKRKEMDI